MTFLTSSDSSPVLSTNYQLLPVMNLCEAPEEWKIENDKPKNAKSLLCSVLVRAHLIIIYYCWEDSKGLHTLGRKIYYFIIISSKNFHFL